MQASPISKREIDRRRVLRLLKLWTCWVSTYSTHCWKLHPFSRTLSSHLCLLLLTFTQITDFRNYYIKTSREWLLVACYSYNMNLIEQTLVYFTYIGWAQHDHTCCTPNTWQSEEAVICHFFYIGRSDDSRYFHFIKRAWTRGLFQLSICICPPIRQCRCVHMVPFMCCLDSEKNVEFL